MPLVTSVHTLLIPLPPRIILCARTELQERYGGKLTQHMSGALYEVFSKIMRALVGKKITVPGPFKKCALLCFCKCSKGL